MPICSYVVYPADNSFDVLQQKLNQLAGCEVTPSDQGDVLILVTDTPDDAAENNLQQQLKQIPEIHTLAMTFGGVDQKGVKS